jgi:HIV Tat-specific factor 1
MNGYLYVSFLFILQIIILHQFRLDKIDDLKTLINESVAEAEIISGIKDDVENEGVKTKNTLNNASHNEEDKENEPHQVKILDNEEAEKLANQAIDHLEVKNLLDKPDDELTEEQKELKYKLIKKEKKKRYRKNKNKMKWYKWKINSNIYITGLPNDVTPEELEEHFSKWGAIRIDPQTGKYKIKIYKDDNGIPKGDALMSFENLESVETAVEMLDDSNLRADAKIKVQPAEFQQKGEEYRERKRQKIDEVEKKRIQAEKERRFAWNSEQANSFGLKIVILKHLFTPEEVKDNEKLFKEIEYDVNAEIEETWGKTEKVEFFREHPDGVIKIKFDDSLSAEKWVEIMNGRIFDGREVIAEYWDGKTDYKKISESTEDVSQRVNEFGEWLENQELPEELKQKREVEIIEGE